MTRILTIPRGILRTHMVDWDIDWGDQMSGTSNEGTRQVYFSRFPRWVGSLSVSAQGANIGAWQAIKAHGQGRSGLWSIPMINPVAFDLCEGSAGNQISSGVPFSSGVRFDGGGGFAVDPLGRVSGAYSAGAELIRMDTTAAGIDPRLGQIMSVGTGYDTWPFRVTGVTHVNGNIYDVNLQMPLRRAVADGDLIRMRGVGLFEATESMTGNTSYGPARNAQFTFSLREFINR